MSELKDISIRLTADVSRFRRAMKDLQRQVPRVNRRLRRLTRALADTTPPYKRNKPRGYGC